MSSVHFLGWNSPPLPLAAEMLVECAERGDFLDLSKALVVTPGKRAGRRLLELMVERAEKRGTTLSPPRFITPGELSEILTGEAQTASKLERLLAWVTVLPEAEPILMESPPGSIALALRLDSLIDEISAGNRTLSDLVRLVESPRERERYSALERLYAKMCCRLSEAKLVDPRSSSAVLRTTPSHIYLVGTIDLNERLRSLLPSCEVTALVPAPPSGGFDELGCLRVEYWKEEHVALTAEQVAIARGPWEQAGAVISALGRIDDSVTNVTVCVADDEVTPFLFEECSRAGIPLRSVTGHAPARLILLFDGIRQFHQSRRFSDFAALLRHPDIEHRIAPQLDFPFLEYLDRYHAEHLQTFVHDRIFGSSKWARGIQAAYALVAADFLPRQDRAPLSDHAAFAGELALRLYGEPESDPELREGLDQLFCVIDDLMSLRIDPLLSISEALEVLISELSSISVPPPPDERAVEIVGWLELPLDDAPHTIIVGMNDGSVPAVINAHPFLPNTLRTRLGLLDNDLRYSRDLFLLRMVAESRRVVSVICGRQRGSGEFLKPSRLLYTGPREELPAKVLRFYRDLPTRPRDTAPAEAFTLPPPEGKKITALTPSALNTYLVDPYRYYLEQILMLSPVNDNDREMPAMLYGTFAHNLMESFGRSDAKDSSDEREILDCLLSLLERQFEARFGPHPYAAVSIQRELLSDQLRRFARWQAKRRSEGWIIESVETRVPEGVCLIGDLGVSLCGRIDRIDRHLETGHLAVFDYKFGETTDAADKAHYHKGKTGLVWKSIQLPAYAWMLRALGRSEPIELALLRADTEEVFSPFGGSAPVLAEARDVIIRVARQIQEGVFPEVERRLRPDDPFAILFTGEVFDETPDDEIADSEEGESVDA